MNPGPAISADASQPLGSRRRASTVSATTRGGFPACRASTSATLVARSPNFRSAGTSTVKGGGRSTGSAPAVITSFSAWRRSASSCRFIPVRTAPKPVAGIRREHGPGRDHGASLYRLVHQHVKSIRGRQTTPRARPLLARGCAARSAAPTPPDPVARPRQSRGRLPRSGAGAPLAPSVSGRRRDRTNVYGSRIAASDELIGVQGGTGRRGGDPAAPAHARSCGGTLLLRGARGARTGSRGGAPSRHPAAERLSLPQPDG